MSNTYSKKNSHAKDLWGLDWEKNLPVQVGEYSFHLSSYEEFVALKNQEDSFLVTSQNVSTNLLEETALQSKERFLDLHCDIFAFKKGDEVVGVCICNVLDWSAYYVRYLFVAEAHRFHNLNNLFSDFLEKNCFDHGVDKLVCEVSPANTNQVSRLSRIGWTPTGNSLSERFGSNILMTKFVSKAAQKVFNESFTLTFYNTREGMTPSRKQTKGVAS